MVGKVDWERRQKASRHHLRTDCVGGCKCPVYVLIPRTCECYLTWQRLGHMANVIKLRILSWGDYSGLSGWALKAITGVLLRRERKREIWHTQRRKHCEDRGRNWSDTVIGQGTPAVTPRSWEKQETDFPSEYLMERGPANTLIAAPWNWFRISAL